MSKETFGQRLSRLRKEKGITKNDIANKVSVTSQAVSKWEQDQATPDIDILIKLSEIFDVTLDVLLGKDNRTVEMKEKPSKKEIEKMLLKINIISDDGDKVNVNLPLGIVKAFVNKENGLLNFIGGRKSLEGIDFKKIIEIVEQGTVGEIITINSADGDKVVISVE